MPLRYVVLRHEGIAEPHFDLMFETGADSPLTTWRSNDWPLHHGSILTRLADHRRAYLDYEGPLSGDRGFVKRVTAGNFLLRAFDEHRFEGTFADVNLEFTFMRDIDERWLCTFPSA